MLSWLHTDGKYIKNAYGQRVFLRGAAFGNLDSFPWWQGGIESLTHRMNRYMLLSKGKATVIRVPITPFPKYTDPPYMWPNPPTINDEAVAQIVGLAEQNNIYLVLEFHGGLSQSECTRLVDDPTDFVNWWMHWVNLYKDNPIVCGFELYNEPFAPNFGGGDRYVGEEKYRTFITQVCANLSAAHPNALLLVASSHPHWNYIDKYWATHQIPGNIVYTWDYYYKNWGSTIKDLYRQGIETGDFSEAKALLEQGMYWMFSQYQEEYGMACLASEFGWYMKDETEPAWWVQQQHYHEYMNKMESNWYQWWWWANPANLGLCNPGYERLSPTGIVWERFLGHGPILTVRSSPVTGIPFTY